MDQCPHCTALYNRHQPFSLLQFFGGASPFGGGMGGDDIFSSILGGMLLLSFIPGARLLCYGM